MRKILIILLVTLFACEKENIDDMATTASECNPLRFFDPSSDTQYNDSTIYAVETGCFYPQFCQTDTLTIQIYSDVSVILRLFDRDTGLEKGDSYVATSYSGYHTFNIPFSDLDFGGEDSLKLYISVKEEQASPAIDTEHLRSDDFIVHALDIGDNLITNSGFDTDLSGWTQSGSDLSWSWSSDNNNSASVTGFGLADPDSNPLYSDDDLPPGTYRIDISAIALYEGGAAGNLYVYAKNASTGTILDTNILTIGTTLDTYTLIITTDVTANFGFQIIEDENPDQVYYIDYFKVFSGTCPPQLISIDYSNNTDFGGIFYTGSPSAAFTLSLAAQFWQEKTETETEDIEQSSGAFVRAYDRTLFKKRLQLSYMPNYMHKKMVRIFMHDNVTVNGVSYIKRDEYEQENFKRYGLSMGSVWLTEKDTILKNVI